MAPRFKHRVEFGVFLFFYQLTKLLPRRALMAFGRGLGTFVWRVVRFRRGVILDNLTHAFGKDHDAAWIQSVAHSFYRHLGMTLVEFFASGHRSAQELSDNVTVVGREHIEPLLARGQGAVFISGHLGNFELMLPRAALAGFKVYGVVKPQSNQLIDRFHNKIRARENVGIIPTGGSFPQIVEALENGGFVGLMSDQDAGRRGQFVDFLGRPASVTRGPATLAFKSGCPVLMVFVVRQPDMSHVMTIKPLEGIDPGWDQETAITRITELHTAQLEQAVRENPELYYWVHRRWKTQPPKSDVAPTAN